MMKSKYLSGVLEHFVDKTVNIVMKQERKLVQKYTEDKRTIEDMLFRDEVLSNLTLVTTNQSHHPPNQSNKKDSPLH